MFIGNLIYATDYYWIGGDGNWSDINHWATISGGTINHIQTPTANDNVIIDGNSSAGDFEITLNLGTIYSKDFDASQITDNLILNGNCNLWKIYGSYILSDKISIPVNPKLYFEAASGNLNIKSHQKLFGKNIYFKGAAKWTLLDDMRCNNISFESGTFKTNSFELIGGNLTSNTSFVRKIECGNSNIRLLRWEVSGNGYTVDAGNSNITITSGNFSHNSNGNYVYHNILFTSFGNMNNQNSPMEFHKMEFRGNGIINGDNTYDSLIFNKGKDYTLEAGKTQSINDILIAKGDCKKPLSITAGASYASISKSSGTLNCEYLILKHIHGIGGATFNAVGSIDNGDNTGWNITEPPSRILYWVGDDGEWNDTIHWSATSGGPGGECIPTEVDNIFIDELSFTQNSTIELNYPYGVCHDFYWADTTASLLQFVNDIYIHGSLRFGDSTELSPHGHIYFKSNQSGETVTTSNIELNAAELLFEGEDGEWILQDSIKNKEGIIMHTKGHLNTNSQYLDLLNMSIFGVEPRELSLGSSIIDIGELFHVMQDTLVVNPNTSHIRFFIAGGQLITEGQNADEFYNVTFESDTGIFYSDIQNTIFNKIERFQDMELAGICFSDTVILKKGKNYLLKFQTDYINNAFIAIGDCHNIISIHNNSDYSNNSIIMPTGSTVNVSNIALRGCEATGGASFIANNSNDLGNNDGWIFANTSQDHYWVGGNGRWLDSAHWSASSGGTGGLCIPKIYDDVYFDTNSDFNSGDSVLVDSNNIFCRDMDWTGAPNNPAFIDTSDYSHYISGSLKFINDMDYKSYAKTIFVDEQQNKTIESAGNTFDGDIIIADSGQWTLIDTLKTLRSIKQYKGRFLTAQNPVYSSSYYALFGFHKYLDIQNNSFFITDDTDSRTFSWIHNDSTDILTNNSEIIFIEGGYIHVAGQSGQVDFHNVFFKNEMVSGIIKHENSITLNFNSVHFEGDGKIEGDNHYDSLFFAAGGTYQLEGGQHQYINSYLEATGNCYKDIAIMPIFGGIANLHSNVPINIEYVKLNNINAIGNGPWVDNNGTDMGGNSSNWQIIPILSRKLYWVNNTGSWLDTAHWSLSAGGASGECIPTKIDNVEFNNNSFTGIDTIISSSIVCHNMEWINTSNLAFVHINYMNIYGSLLLSDSVNIGKVYEVRMKAEDQGNIIRSKGHPFPRLFFLTDGEWTLNDDLSAQKIFHEKGYLNANHKGIKSDFYNSWYNSPRKLDITNSLFIAKYSIKIKTDSLTFISNNSEIHFIDTNGIPNFTFEIKGDKELSFHNVSFDEVMVGSSLVKNYSNSHHSFNKMTINNSASIYGEHSFDSLIFHAGNTYKLEYAKNQEIGDYWFVRGNNCYAINLQSTKKYNQAFVNKDGGVVTADFMNVRDISVGGSSLFFAGSFSTDIDNNTGWNFTNGPQYVYGLGPDTNFSIGTSVTLSTTNFNGGPHTTYLWSTGSTADQISVNQTGWYYITVSYAGDCIVLDSIFVGCNIEMDYDIVHNICFGDSLGSIQALIPDPNYTYTYSWSNSDTTAFISGLAAGDYMVIVGADNGLCLVFDTLEVNEADQIYSAQSDTAFCIDDSIRLDLGNYQDFDWNDSHQGQYRWVSKADTFYIKVQDADGCWSVLDTLEVRQDEKPETNLGKDTTICYGEYVVLDAGDGFEEYLWSNNSAMNPITISNTGEYWVRVKQRTCYAYDTMMVYNCPAKFEVPNVFTPNGDGFNDYFEIVSQNIYSFEIRVYSRWGLLIHKGSNLDLPWNGKILGEDAIEGVYFWHIIYQEYNGQGGGYEEKIVKGTVTLMR